MVTLAASAHTSTADSVGNNSEIDRDIDNVIDVGQFAERVGLGYRTREPVKKKAVTAIFLVDSIRYYTDDYFVGDKLSVIYKGFCKPTEFGTGFDIRSQSVAGRNVRDFIVVTEDLRLSSFARAGRA